jgi:hypothetical protein
VIPVPILKNYRQYSLVIGLIIVSLIAVFAVVSVFPSKIPQDREVSSEIVIGIVTLSGLIFAFQPTIFKIKKTGFYRILFLAIFSVEGLVLGLVGYSFTSNALSLNYLTEYSLFLAYSSLILDLAMSAYFVLVDLVIQAEEEAGLK